MLTIVAGNVVLRLQLMRNDTKDELAQVTCSFNQDFGPHIREAAMQRLNLGFHVINPMKMHILVQGLLTFRRHMQ